MISLSLFLSLSLHFSHFIHLYVSSPLYRDLVSSFSLHLLVIFSFANAQHPFPVFLLCVSFPSTFLVHSTMSVVCLLGFYLFVHTFCFVGFAEFLLFPSFCYYCVLFSLFIT